MMLQPTFKLLTQHQKLGFIALMGLPWRREIGCRGALINYESLFITQSLIRLNNGFSLKRMGTEGHEGCDHRR